MSSLPCRGNDEGVIGVGLKHHGPGLGGPPEVVGMLRQSEVFVRELTPGRGRATDQGCGTGPVEASGIVLESVEGRRAVEAAAIVGATPQYAPALHKWSGVSPPG